MKRQTLFATAIVLCFGALPVAGLCQAAAEYSMTTAGTASATANAGSKMGSALNFSLDKTQLAGRHAERVVRPAAARREVGRMPRRIAGVRPVAANPQLAGSVTQMRPSFDRSGVTAKSGVTPCVATPVNASPGDKANAACKPATPVEYPSAVTLSFPKQ